MRLFRMLAGMMAALAVIGQAAAGRSEGTVSPRPRAGWELRMEGDPEWRRLALSRAPRLSPWTPHQQPAAEPTDIPLAATEIALEEELQGLLGQALQIVNRYLPEPFQHDFQLWVVEDIPYAAKTLDPQILLSSRILTSRQRPRLPYVLAHEVHHLWLIRAGVLKPHPLPRDNLLAGLLSEGIATWLCLESNLFPELEEILGSPDRMAESFRRVRKTLADAAPRETAAAPPDGKWSYYAGTWMIRDIEREYGRQAWLNLLVGPPGGAGRRLLELYRRTDPPEEYRF